MGLVPPASGCRAGAPVRLLRANGAAMAATVRVSTSEDAEGSIQHAVQVRPPDALCAPAELARARSTL